PLDRLLLALLARLVARPVLDRLGGRIRVAVSGGAPLSPVVARFFIGLGLPLTQGYGLTEAAPVVSGSAPKDCVPGSVGAALPGVQVRLTPQDELLVRAPSLMLGYWRRPESTREVIDDQGWLHTGDLAGISDGNITIRGRLKEILVTSSGEKVPPADMEMALTLDPLFDQAMVLGEGRPYLAALLVLNGDAWSRLARRLGLDPEDPASLESGKALQSAQSRVRERLKGFPGFAQVRALHLRLEPWTVENGLMTPTLKLKREQLESRFDEVIQGLFRHRAIPR
ncbi:MAG: AMP-binding protein, partial [Chromatiaceae bacterium]